MQGLLSQWICCTDHAKIMISKKAVLSIFNMAYELGGDSIKIGIVGHPQSMPTTARHLGTERAALG